MALPSLATLQKVAIGGFVISASTSAYFYINIQDNIRKNGHYPVVVRTVSQDKACEQLLGSGLRFGNLSLIDKYNVVNAREVKVKIPVVGSKKRGVVIANATRDQEVQGNSWDITHCEVRSGTHRLLLVGSETFDPLAQESAEKSESAMKKESKERIETNTLSHGVTTAESS